MIRRCLLVLAVLVLPATSAAAKSYSAERYDVRIQVQDDGSLRVTETIILQFEEGSFSEFFREIPTRRTDGIEILEAAINGRRLPWPDGSGRLEISGQNQRKVVFRFDPVERVRRTFTITYRVDGAIRQSGTADRLLWRALPSDHDYPIAVATIAVEAPVAPRSSPGLDSRRIAAATTLPTERGMMVTVENIRTNGWVEVDLQFEPGSIIDAPPAWQARAIETRKSAPIWLAAGAAALMLGLVPVGLLRTRYESPPPEEPSTHPVRTRPDRLPAALAGALVANGQVRAAHAMATVFALADQGVVTIAESRARKLGQRKFEVRLFDEKGATSEIERVILEHLFRHGGEHQASVPLTVAARRLSRHLPGIRTVVQQALAVDGLWDVDRAAVRRAASQAAVAVFGGAGLSAAVVAFLVPHYRGWPFLITAGLVVAGIVGLVAAGSYTPLSNVGVQRAAAWKDYRKFLKSVAAGKARLDGQRSGSLLATAVALGIATEWSRYLKTHPGDLPAWFTSWSATDDHAAFAALIATTAATSSAGASTGAGAAAGGGASGAS